MVIKVDRFKFTDDTTYGKLYLNDEFFCYTLEDKDRGLNKTDSKEKIRRIKVPKETACPAGDYRVVLSWSTKLKRFLPLLLSVPLGKGVRIHRGSSKFYTSACILVGMQIGADGKLKRIREAEDKLMEKLKYYNEREELYITIKRNGV